MSVKINNNKLKQIKHNLYSVYW